MPTLFKAGVTIQIPKDPNSHRRIINSMMWKLTAREMMQHTKKNQSGQQSKKACDVVWPKSVFVSLHEQCITSPLWKLYSDMYSKVSSRLKVNEELLEEVEEGQGIRQGVETSKHVFNTCTSSFLNQDLNYKTPSGLAHSLCVAYTCTNDTCLMTTSHVGTQTAMYLAQNDANRERY